VKAPVGLLVMAYGTASGPDEIERYYTDIRGGRPPSPEQLRELEKRYAAIGNRFPLLEMTRRQAEGLAAALSEGSDGSGYRAYLGMKHSPPFIQEGVARMREDGIERAVGIVMAPHWSAMSVETYVERVEGVVEAHGGPSFTFVRSWYDHPAFVSFLAERVGAALDRLGEDERDGAAVVFSAHSLPVRTEEDGSRRCSRCDACPQGCTYRSQLEHTAELVAKELGLPNATIAWQSAGRTAVWWGPPVEQVIERLAASGTPGVVVCAAGFVADHLEVLYDLDIEAREVAEAGGIRFERTEMPNADPGFASVLAAIVRDHLAAQVP